jgi:hypothetical protein
MGISSWGVKYNRCCLPVLLAGVLPVRYLMGAVTFRKIWGQGPRLARGMERHDSINDSAISGRSS